MAVVSAIANVIMAIIDGIVLVRIWLSTRLLVPMAQTLILLPAFLIL